MNNKNRFDRTHRLRPNQIEEGIWVIVYDRSLEHQYSTMQKFARKWFGPYLVVKLHDNTTYLLQELDGTHLRIPIVGKQIKAFKRRDGRFAMKSLEEVLSQQNNHEESNPETESEGDYNYEDVEE